MLGKANGEKKNQKVKMKFLKGACPMVHSRQLSWRQGWDRFITVKQAKMTEDAGSMYTEASIHLRSLEV